MLEILDPRPSVLLLVWISHDSFARFSTLFELSCVNLAIKPNFSSEALHIGIFEFTGVSLVHVGKKVSSLALKDPVNKVALIVAPIGPLVNTVAIFLTVFEHAFILRLIGVPALNTLAMLAVRNPFTLVAVPFKIRKFALSVGLVVGPFSFIHISCGVDQASIAVPKTHAPHALVH